MNNKRDLVKCHECQNTAMLVPHLGLWCSNCLAIDPRPPRQVKPMSTYYPRIAATVGVILFLASAGLYCFLR